MMQTITPMQEDALREVLNLAACNASNSLSILLKRKVQMEAPIMHIDEIQNIPKFIKNPQDVKTIVLVETSEDMQGHLMIVTDPQSTLELLEILTGKKVQHIEVLNEFEKSALCEVGNILTGSAITALNDFLKFKIVQSISDVAIDMIGALFNNLMAQIGTRSNTALEFNMDFKVDGTNISGSMIGILSPESTKKIIQTLNKKFNQVIQ